VADFGLPHITEKRYLALAPMLLTANGSSDGTITVASTYRIKVGQTLKFKSSSVAIRLAKVKRVISTSQFIVIDPKDSVATLNKLDMSDLLTADTATVELAQDKRPVIELLEIQRQTYEEEPTVAMRTHAVDWLGRSYSKSNPVPVELSDGSISIGTVNAELEVQLSHQDNVPDVGDVHDSVRIGDGTHTLEINSDGSINVTDNGGSLTVDGTVNIGNFPATQNVAIVSSVELEIKNDSGNPVPVNGTVTANQGTNPWTVNGNVSATITGTLPGINPDAFGRTRMSEPFTLGDYKHVYAIDPNFLDRKLNGGSVTYNQDKACATLSTTSNTLSSAVHQTKMYHHYQPGKSQLILTSSCLGYAQKNVTKRTGYYDDRDGIYFEQVGNNDADGTSNGQLNWVIRSYTSGTASEAAVGSYIRRVPQSQWNIDKCDGTGASGFNLDTSKTQLAWMDFQWLGVGRVRCGFVHDGAFVIAHEYYHSNVLPEVYISNPNLPVRCEIFNTGITTGGSMDQICSTVASEGGYVESGIDFAVTSPKRTTPAIGQTRLPLMAIRLKNSFNGYPNRLSVRPNQLSIYCTGESVMYEVVKLSSVSSLSTTLNAGVLVWTPADMSSGVEYCVNATDFVSADADRFATGFVSSGSSQNSLAAAVSGTLTSAKKNIISQNIDSTDSEVYVILVSTVEPGNNVQAQVVCGLQWREIY
jgi:hypothetical protein